MSRSTVASITCPECGEASALDLWEWINVSLDPGLRDEVVSGEINRFECPDCGFEAQIERPLLYLDPHRSLVAYAAPREWANDPDVGDLAQADAARLASAVAAESLGTGPTLPDPLPVLYGYPRLAWYVLGAEALETLEDVLAPDQPTAALSATAQTQLTTWRDLIAARSAGLPAWQAAVATHLAELRMPLFGVLFSAIGRAARGDDVYLADYLRAMGDALLETALGAPATE